MIDKPKKERRFLKTLGKIGEILIQEVLIKIGSNLIKKIGGKKTLPSILFLLASLSLFAQYPATGNKQRLGYQTTGDGLLFRGRSNDTTALKPSTINNAYFILDTVNNVLFNYIKTKGGWVFNNTDTVINNITVDTTSLSNRINLKLNISDTASMLTPYFKDADTTSLNLTSRFGAKLNISDTASMLTNYLRTGVAASTYLSGSGTTNYIPKFTGSKILGNSLINDNGNYIGINKTTPTVGIDLINDISSTSAKLRLQTNFQTAIRTLELGSGDGLSWDLPGGTSQSPFIKVVGGDISSGGGGLNLMTNDISRLFIRQNGTIGIGTITPSATFEVHGSAVFNEGSTDSDFRVESDANVNMVFVDASTDRVGIGTNAPTKTLEVNGTFNATGDITEGGLNVLTSADTSSLSSRIDTKVSLTATESIGGTKTFNNLVNITNHMTISGSVSGGNQLLGKNSSNNGVSDITLGTGLSITSNVLNASTTDTTSLSNRINLKYDKTGGTISGAVTLSTTTATPTALLGKDGSNVVGTVTTLAQTGLIKAGGTTTNTSSVGIITVAHGLSYTPSQVFVTLAQQSNYIAVCHAITSTNLSFTFYDSTTGIALNNISVGFFWLAIK